MSDNTFNQRATIEGAINRALSVISSEIEDAKESLQEYLDSPDGEIVASYEDRFYAIQMLGGALEIAESQYWKRQKNRCLERVESYKLASGEVLRLPNLQYGSINRAGDEIRSEIRKLLVEIDNLPSNYLPRGNQVKGYTDKIESLDMQRDALQAMLLPDYELPPPPRQRVFSF